MGYALEFNCLLVDTDSELNFAQLKVGERYTVTKSGERLYPLNIPIELCNAHYEYFGKIVVKKLTLEANITILEFELLKIFSPEEALVYTTNFIKPK